MKLKVRIPSLEEWARSAPCERACPVHTSSGRYVRAIAEGRYEEAYELARRPNPLASVCARVCAAPCEDRCRRAVLDSPVTIRSLKWFVCDLFEEREKRLLPCAPKYPEKVAVVGGGPAGMACAEELVRLGYRVTIFEAGERLGGALWKFIPPFRLSREVVDLEAERLQKLGVEIRTDTPLSEDFGLAELKKEYQAVFIACGANQGLELAIEGRDAEGVYKAVDFLFAVNQGLKVELGQRVVVIGGGNVAVDVARTVLRYGKERAFPSREEGLTGVDVARAAKIAGAKEVLMACLESWEEMPARKTQQGREEMEETLAEGIKLLTGVGPKRILTQEGKVRGVEFWEVERLFDEKGRFNPTFKPGTERQVEADTVILAIGQRPDLSFIKEEDGVEITPRGTIKVDPETLATTAPGVYAGGDAAFGPGIIIKAVADGQKAARSIHRYLRQEETEKPVKVQIHRLPPKGWRKELAYEKIPRFRPEEEERWNGERVFRERVFTEEEAREQAERCLDCYIQTVYEAELCVFCRACEEICPQQCLRFCRLEDLEGENPATQNYLENNSGIALLKNEDLCIRCALCARVCPTGAMGMEKIFATSEA